MKLSLALLLITAAAIAITQTSFAAPSGTGFLARRRLAQAAAAPAAAPSPATAPTGGGGGLVQPATLLPASPDDPAASDLAARLSRTMSPAEICAAAKEIYGAAPAQCDGVDTKGAVKKVVSIPVGTGPVDPRDANNDGTVDVLDGPNVVDVAPLTSGVPAGRGGRVLAAVVAGAAAATVLLM